MAGKRAATGPGNAATGQRGSPGARERAARQRDSRHDGKADAGDAALTDRPQPDKRGLELGERGQALREAVQRLERDMQQTIDRAHAILNVSRTKLGPQDPVVQQSPGRREQQRAGKQQVPPGGGPPVTATLAHSGELIQRSAGLQEQARAVIQAFAASEDNVARIHEELASRYPQRGDGYRRAAGQARTAARRARDILRTFSS